MNLEESHTNNNEVKISGFMVTNDREKIRDLKPELLESFDAAVGKRKYIASNFYPIEESLLYQKTACKLLLGSESPENYRQMGEMDFNSIIATQFGKISLSLFARDLESALTNFPKAFKIVIKGVEMTSVRIKSCHFKLHIDIDPYPPNYWTGFFQAFMKFFKKEATVEQESDENQGCIITIIWNEA